MNFATLSRALQYTDEQTEQKQTTETWQLFSVFIYGQLKRKTDF